MKDKFYILSMDGGGFRGAYSAYLLKRMEDEWAIDWRAKFDMFAGTSTGSIIAAGLACGLTANELFSFYVQHGKDIFRKRWFAKLDILSLSGLLASRYSNRKLKDILHQQVGDVYLGDLKVPLIIPSVDIGGGQVHVFKSAYDNGFVRDAKVLVADAVMASCAAPTYFNPYIVDPYTLVDGGLWANNPSLVAAIDAKRRLGINLDDIRIFSVGTGKSKKCYPRKTGWLKDILLNSWLGWGFATRWGSNKFIDTLLSLQADTAHNMLRLLLQKDDREPEQLLRINFESDKALSMNDPFKLDDWKRQADRDFTYNSVAIKNFLNISNGFTGDNVLTNKELNEALINLAEELDISPTKYKQAVDRYTAVGDWLNDGNYKGVCSELDIYPQGSFRLGTVIRPLKDGKESDYDIDLVCQLPLLRKATSPEALKNAVGDRLKENGKYSKMLDKEGRRCWTLLYSEEDGIGFHLDVLPSVLVGEITQKRLNEAMAQYQYARYAVDITEKDIDSGTYTWKISGSNPRGYAVWFEDRNRAAFVRVESYQRQVINEKYATVYASVEEVPNELIRTPLQRSIQILKRHRDIFFKNDPDNKPISMIITTLAAIAYNGETDLVTALYNIVDMLTGYNSLSQLTESAPGLIRKVGGNWVIPNPVNPDENFADRWNDKGSQRPQEFFRWLAKLRQDFDYAKQYRDITSMGKFLWPIFGVQISKAEVPKFNIIESKPKKEFPQVKIENPARPWRP